VIQNGRTYLPAKWVANALGYQVDWNAANQIVIIWPNGTTEPGIVGNVAHGFIIPTGTNLDVDSTQPTGPDYSFDFQVDGSKGDIQGQVTDAQNILSQAQYLDPATIAKAITLINKDTTIQTPTWSDTGIFNSPNGGSIEINSTAFVMNEGNCMINILSIRNTGCRLRFRPNKYGFFPVRRWPKIWYNQAASMLD
jgi:hypothetical protein